LKTRVQEREDGTKSYRTEVVVGNIIFLSKKSDFEGENGSD
jgi:single-stranded DNA-binding protein